MEFTGSSRTLLVVKGSLPFDNQIWPGNPHAMFMSTHPDLLLVHDFFPDHAPLYETLLSTVAWDTSMAARQTASFGAPYNYSQMRYLATAMHPALLPVVTALCQRLQIRFNNCLLNYYASGENSMGFHADDTAGLQPGTGVAIVSLGNARDITFRSVIDHAIRHAYALAPGSLLYMNAAVQDAWQHAIARQPHAGPRISLTWRAVVEVP